MQLKLLAFDTDRIKDFVFATDALKEIRGASALLDQLNRERMTHIVQRIDSASRKIYAHGGGGLFLVAAEHAETARLAVEQAYHKYSGHAASVTGIILDVPDGFDEQRPIQQIYELLQFKLRQTKDQTPVALSITASPYLRPCDNCGEFPASSSSLESGQRKLLCYACRARRLTIRGVWERLQSYGLPPGVLPQDFDKLGKASSPSGYIGLLYADGNGMGRKMKSLSTLAAVRRFAEAVDGTLHQTARDVIQTHLAPDNGVFPCVPLLLGGDDFVMVTRAQSAIEAAITLAEKFGDYSEHHPDIDERLSLSVGVVLTHYKFPFRTMLDLAESALSFAKREAVNRQLVDRSLINFLAISSANHLDFKSFYNETLKYQSDDVQEDPWLRTRRPYTPAGLKELVATARTLKGAPRGRLQALGDCVFLKPEQGKLEGATTLLRWRGNAENGPSKDHPKLVRELVSNSLQFPWDDSRTTPIFDLVELFDFVKEG